MSSKAMKNTSLKTEEKSSTDNVVSRPEYYWQELYQRYRSSDRLKKTISKILDPDINLYRKILITTEYQCETVYPISADEVLPTHWVINYYDNEVHVVDHSDAHDILSDWFEFNSLPRHLPNGKKIKEIATFDQLIALMTHFNPYWLLEVCAYTLNERDFARLKPNDAYDYDASVEQIAQIREQLKELLKTLK